MLLFALRWRIFFFGNEFFLRESGIFIINIIIIDLQHLIYGGRGERHPSTRLIRHRTRSLANWLADLQIPAKCHLRCNGHHFSYFMLEAVNVNGHYFLTLTAKSSGKFPCCRSNGHYFLRLKILAFTNLSGAISDIHQGTLNALFKLHLCKQV